MNNKSSFKLGIGIIFIIVILVLVSSAVIVYENEYVLIKQFGKVERVIDKSGLSFKIPFIESAESLPKNILIYDVQSSDVITSDKKTMVVDSYVLWKITEPVNFIQTLVTVNNAEARIDTIVYNAIKTVIGGQTQQEVINGRDGELNKQLADATSMEEYGIELIAVEIKRLDLPDENKSAVYERMISERNQIAASYQAEGEEDAQKIKNQTDKEVAIILSEAEVTAAKTIAEGEAEYMRILQEAYSTPERQEFYSYIRSLEALKISMDENKTLILPADTPLTDVLLGER